MMKRQTLKKVLHLDNIPIDSTYFTEEGYLIDCPIVTTTGIFEYKKPDGSIVRELRLPEHVFNPDSLASYEGKPVIITHSAGEVDKDNVGEEIIGTILSAGYQDGDSVRCKIIIHDTDAMEASQLKELSLGYDLEHDDTSGEWNGQPYDLIQTDIRVNHLALVAKARAGHTARLNIDEDESLEGEDSMAKNSKKTDGEQPVISALEAFHQRRDQRMAAKADTTEEGSPLQVAPPQGQQDTATIDQAQEVRDNRDSRDLDGDPDNLDTALATIAKQDEDIDTLLGVIDALKATSITDSSETDSENQDSEKGDDEKQDSENKDEDHSDSQGSAQDSEGKGGMNADSVDRVVRERIKLGKLGEKVNLDGLEELPVQKAKVKLIQKMKPSLRLDGMGAAYINGIFDVVAHEIDSMKKDTNYQRGQMFRSDGSSGQNRQVSSAISARERMIERAEKGGQ